jgi:stage II sporulation protein M
MKRKTKREKKGKEEFNFHDEYRKSWAYVRESRNYIYVIVGVFLLFIIIGSLFPVPEVIYNQIVAFIRDILEKTKDMSPMQLIGFIISNNMTSTFLGLFFGIILGIFPLVIAIVNGYLLGFVALISVESGGILTLWKLFPHGIFELPAVFISLGLGMRLGTFIFEKHKIRTFKNYLFNSARVFLLIVIPLLIIAGVIEGSLMILLN